MNGCLYKRLNWPFSPYLHLSLSFTYARFFLSRTLPHNSNFSRSSKAYARYCIIFGERFHPAKILYSLFSFRMKSDSWHPILINKPCHSNVNDIACYPQIWWTASMPLQTEYSLSVCCAWMYTIHSRCREHDAILMSIISLLLYCVVVFEMQCSYELTARNRKMLIVVNFTIISVICVQKLTNSTC